MILSDFLSRQKQDDSSPHETMPILFNIQNILPSRYNNIGEREEGKSSCRFIMKVHIKLCILQVASPQSFMGYQKSIKQAIHSGL